VCVPAGTRNHFALDVGVDRYDVTGALNAFTGGVERQIDAAALMGIRFRRSQLQSHRTEAAEGGCGIVSS
jgi:diacylglycerol kinase family enzyme